MADIQTFGFDNEDIKGGLYEKFKPKKGDTYRCAIAYTDPKAMFVGQKVHFKDRFFFCKRGKCCEVLGPAKYKIGAVLIIYNTDRQGNPKKPFGYEVLPWVFGEGTYNKLKNTNDEFPLTTHDIKVTCTNEEYKNVDITPCSECIWTSKEELKTVILDQAKPIWDSLKKTLASDLTTEQINELLGVGTATVVDPTTKIDLNSVLDSI
jgi:hypothetical protein